MRLNDIFDISRYFNHEFMVPEFTVGYTNTVIIRKNNYNFL